jgi:hypothetical protein
VTLDDTKTEDTGSVVISGRDGSLYAIPLNELARFELPEGSIVLRWRDRYLALPAGIAEGFRVGEKEAAAFVEQRGGKGPRNPRGPQRG